MNNQIALKTLNNALKLNKLSHCILFEGVTNSLKKQYAYLLACAIVTGSNDLENLDPIILERIKKHQYLDVIFIDGEKETIKKEDIEKMFKQFKMTGLELNAKKVYILNNINNASNKVLNMLLKFMEEPSSKDTFGILISDDADKLLDTIKSRSFRVKFIKDNHKQLINIYLEHGFNDAEKLVSIGYEYNYFNDKKLYELAKDLSDKLITNINDLEEFVFYLHHSCFEEIKKLDKSEIITLLKLFLDLSIDTLKKQGQYKCIECLINCKDKINNHFDYKLVLDEMVYNLNTEV